MVGKVGRETSEGGSMGLVVNCGADMENAAKPTVFLRVSVWGKLACGGNSSCQKY